MHNSGAIYDEIINHLNMIESQLGSSFVHDELKNGINIARDNFSNWRIKSEKELILLKKSVEWDKLTIAFYGETNAGKSTMIETLRILLKESQKIEQRDQFLNIFKKYNISKEELENKHRLIVKIDSLNEKVIKIEADNVVKLNAVNSIILEKENKINEFNSIISNYSFFKKLISFFKVQRETQEIERLKKTIIELDNEKKAILSNSDNQKQEVNNTINVISSKIKLIESMLEELKKYQDGEIIGDGRSDFTRESTIYNFTFQSGDLQLIDVPGIEGKEELVQDAIMDAVKKAHMVFYVTRKADPPQKGEEKSGTKGTLERIQAHLSAQTEVWTIFNKSIKSPKALIKENLLNSDEVKSLNVLDVEMKKQLHENYQGRIDLSAYPAFLSSTDNFIPDSDNYKNRLKFLNEFDEEELFNKSQFGSLIEKIQYETNGNFSKKIKKSNYNKAYCEIKKLIDLIDFEIEKNLKPLSMKFHEQIESSKKQIRKNSNALLSHIGAEYESAIDKLARKVRAETYKKIEEEKLNSNGDVKSFLIKIIESESKTLDTEVNESISMRIKEYEKGISSILDKNNEILKKYITLSGIKNDIKMDDFETKVNVDLLGVVVNIVGGVMAALFTGGAALILGLISAGFGLVKAVWAYFDDEFKRSEQKNNTNKVLNTHIESLKSELETILANLEKEIEIQVKEINKSLDVPNVNFRAVIEYLEQTRDELIHKSDSIAYEGELK